MSIINNIDWIITFNIYPSGRNRTVYPISLKTGEINHLLYINVASW